jgi:transcriptional repressor NrdR
LNDDNQEQVKISVEKRNGRSEAFDEDKLARGVSRSGTPFVMAKDIAKSIHKRLEEKTKNNAVRSVDIRDYVVEELKSRNEGVIAESYSGYSKNTLTDLSGDNKFDSKVTPTQRSHQKEYAKQKDATNEEESKRGLR